MSITVTTAPHAEGRRQDRVAPFVDARTLERDAWNAGAEQITIEALQNGYHTLGCIGIRGRTGVSKFSSRITESLARTGYRSLHVDLSLRSRSAGDRNVWISPHDDPARWIYDETGLSARLVAEPTLISRSQFNDTPGLRRLFTSEALRDRVLVLDLPPLHDRDPEAINPIPSAAACDAVILLCTSGRTRRQELQQAVETLRANHVKVVGLVLNDGPQTSPAEEIGSMVRRLFFLIPPLARSLQARISKAHILQ